MCKIWVGCIIFFVYLFNLIQYGNTLISPIMFAIGIVAIVAGIDDLIKSNATKKSDDTKSIEDQE